MVYQHPNSASDYCDRQSIFGYLNLMGKEVYTSLIDKILLAHITPYQEHRYTLLNTTQMAIIC